MDLRQSRRTQYENPFCQWNGNGGGSFRGLNGLHRVGESFKEFERSDQITACGYFSSNSKHRKEERQKEESYTEVSEEMREYDNNSCLSKIRFENITQAIEAFLNGNLK